jgi:hypothetical protein
MSDSEPEERNVDISDLIQRYSKKAPVVDKRKETSKLNAEKARQAKLANLQAKKERHSRRTVVEESDSDSESDFDTESESEKEEVSRGRGRGRGRGQGAPPSSLEYRRMQRQLEDLQDNYYKLIASKTPRKGTKKPAAARKTKIIIQQPPPVAAPEEKPSQAKMALQKKFGSVSF